MGHYAYTNIQVAKAAFFIAYNFTIFCNAYYFSAHFRINTLNPGGLVSLIAGDISQRTENNSNMKLISHWSVFAHTKETMSQGLPPSLLGVLPSPDPVVCDGFLLYENQDGNRSGINLSQVLCFSIVPEYEE